MFETMDEIQRATIAARKRTGNTKIGVNVGQGRFNIVEVTYRSRRAVADVLTIKGDLSKDELIAALNAMEA